MSQTRIAVACGLFALLALCLFPFAPIEIVFYLVFHLALGWAAFLARVATRVRIDPGGIATGVACLVLLAVGSHLLLRWLYEQMRGPDVGRRWKPRWTASLIAAVVVMFAAGIATTGVAHQVGWLFTSREPLVEGGLRPAARRSQSANNLKQIGFGLSNYHESMRTFPPGGTFDDRGRPLHGWQTMLLPYIEQNNLFNAIDLGVPWDDPRNAMPFRTEVHAYLHPGLPPTAAEDREGYALGHYAGNARLLGGNVPRSLADIPDGGSGTIMVGEVAGGFKPWGGPANWRDPAAGINRSPDGFGGPYKGGANFLFADGSVRFLKDGIDPRVLKALSTPDGGEPVPPE